MKWKVLNSGVKSGGENMRLDAQLLESLDAPILHFYDWATDAATYGYFVNPASHFKLDRAHDHTLELARRPTGGGIVFHNCDLAFSILVPASAPVFSPHSLINYAFVNERIKKVIAAFKNEEVGLEQDEESFSKSVHKDFCMAAPTKYDVMLNGKKVGGAAQRKTRQGYLHQGSILLAALPEAYLDDILVDPEVGRAMQQKSVPLLQGYCREEIKEARQHLCRKIEEVFTKEYE